MYGVDWIRVISAVSLGYWKEFHKINPNERRKMKGDGDEILVEGHFKLYKYIETADKPLNGEYKIIGFRLHNQF